MKKILSLLMLLVAIVTGAKASSESDLTAITSSTVIVADGLNGTSSLASGTLYNNGTVLSLGSGSGYSTSKGSSTYNETTYKNVYQLKTNRVVAIKVGMDATVTIYGNTHDSRAYNIGTTSGGSEIAAGKNGEGIVSGDVDGSTTPKVVYFTATSDLYFALIVVEMKTPAAAPVITTDLPEAADVTVGVAEEFSIVATGATSYQWYNGEDAIEGATSATYSYTATAAGTVNLHCVATNSVGYATSNVCAVTATAPANPPVITTNLEAAYNVIKNQTQELSIAAEDASSYQWYLDGEAVEGATTDSYTFTAGSTIGATNEVYCKAINAAGTTNSTVATITTVGRTDCELTNIKFSNGAYGAINSATYGDGTIAVPYMAGTEAPTVEEASINISDGATYVLSGNTLTVTAEDETTSKEFTINAVEITPLAVSADVAKTEFTAVPSWVFNLYGFGENNGDKDYKGVKFAKKVDEASNMRIALGNTRQYWFIGAAKSITLTSGTGAERDIKVYRNGVQLSEPTKTAAKGSDITIALDETAPCMIMIESNQTGGDGGFTFYAIEAAAAQSQNVTVGETGFATIGLPFAAEIPAGVTAYAVTAVNDGKVTTSEAIAAGEVLPANQGFIITAAANSAFTFTEAASATYTGTSLLQAAGADGVTATATAPIFVLAKISDTKVGFRKSKSGTLDAYKAYLSGTNVSGESLEIDFGGAATAINGIAEAEAEAAPVKVVKNGKLYIGNYNVAGQLVK